MFSLNFLTVNVFVNSTIDKISNFKSLKIWHGWYSILVLMFELSNSLKRSSALWNKHVHSRFIEPLLETVLILSEYLRMRILFCSFLWWYSCSSLDQECQKVKQISNKTIQGLRVELSRPIRVFFRYSRCTNPTELSSIAMPEFLHWRNHCKILYI